MSQFLVFNIIKYDKAHGLIILFQGISFKSVFITQTEEKSMNPLKTVFFQYINHFKLI